jgi:sugar phosphate isomerase/epimerase
VSFPDPPTLLFSTAALFARPLAATMDTIAEAGFTGVEVLVTSDPASREPRTIRELAAERGLIVGAIHAPCLLLTRRVWGTDPVGKVYRAIETAERAGVPLVVVHPPFRWQPGFARWLEDRLPGLVERTGVDVAVENMFPIKVGGRATVKLHTDRDLDELDRYGSLVLDTSHAVVAGHDPVEVRRRFGSRLRHVHLSDNAGKGWDSHLPLGEGVLDVDAVLDDLAAGGFAGNVSLEVDLRRFASDPAKLLEAMVAMRERCEAKLSLSA